MAEEKNIRRSEILSDEELENVVGGAPHFEFFRATGRNIPESVQKLLDENKSGRRNLNAN